MKEDITILVNSCDTYEDTWFPFFKLFKKNWPECPYEIILNTETKKFVYQGLNICCFQLYEQSFKPAYGERLLEHLKRVKTEFVLLLMDDFFLRSKVDEEYLVCCKKWMQEDKNIAVFSFANVNDTMNIPSEKYPDFEMRPQCGEYKINLQAGIWRRETLMKYIRKHETPWEIETIGSMRSFDSKDKFYVLKSNVKSPIDYGKKSGLTWGIVRGKWILEDVKPLFEENDIHLDFGVRGELKNSDLENFNRNNRRSEYRTIKSLGFKLWFRIFCWRIYRYGLKILGKKVDKDYIMYLRRKENESRLN